MIFETRYFINSCLFVPRFSYGNFVRRYFCVLYVNGIMPCYRAMIFNLCYDDWNRKKDSPLHLPVWCKVYHSLNALLLPLIKCSKKSRSILYSPCIETLDCYIVWSISFMYHCTCDGVKSNEKMCLKLFFCNASWQSPSKKKTNFGSSRSMDRQFVICMAAVTSITMKIWPRL